MKIKEVEAISDKAVLFYVAINKGWAPLLSLFSLTCDDYHISYFYNDRFLFFVDLDLGIICSKKSYDDAPDDVQMLSDIFDRVSVIFSNIEEDYSGIKKCHRQAVKKLGPKPANVWFDKNDKVMLNKATKITNSYWNNVSNN